MGEKRFIGGSESPDEEKANSGFSSGTIGATGGEL